MRSEELSVYLQDEPRLNFDILRLVCDYLSDVPDVLSFALTCSALTEDALRQRLRMAPVNLSKSEVINSLHTFIFSNEPSRALCLYGLKIPMPYYYDLQFSNKSLFDVINSQVVTILEAATNIQYLDLATSISDAVCDAAVKLTTVRELRIFNDAYQGRLLTRIPIFPSRLRSLHIRGSHTISGYIISLSFLHDRLVHLAPTLELLDLDDDCLIDIFPSSVTTQFAAVRSLKLRIIFFPDCDVLGVLSRLFPNLETLDLDLLNAHIREDDVLAFREQSERSQKQNGWSGLDQLVCDADTAYLIALQCPIRRMHIKVGTSGAARHLTKTLCHHSPPQLHVHLSALYDGFVVLDGLFPPEAADKLTHLVIFVDVEIRHERKSCRRTQARGNVPSNRLVVSEQTAAS